MFNAITHRRYCLLSALPVHYTTSYKHSLVLLRMDEIVARNMLSWLQLSIKSVIVASNWLFILLYQWCTVTKHQILYSFGRLYWAWIDIGLTLPKFFHLKVCKPKSQVNFNTNSKITSDRPESSAFCLTFNPDNWRIRYLHLCRDKYVGIWAEFNYYCRYKILSSFKHVITGIRRNNKDVKCKENSTGILNYIKSIFMQLHGYTETAESESVN